MNKELFDGLIQPYILLKEVNPENSAVVKLKIKTFKRTNISVLNKSKPTREYSHRGRKLIGINTPNGEFETVIAGAKALNVALSTLYGWCEKETNGCCYIFEREENDNQI